MGVSFRGRGSAEVYKGTALVWGTIKECRKQEGISGDL